MINGLTQVDERLDPQTQRVNYRPVILTVGRSSDFNPNEVAFKEIDGFWAWSDNVLNAEKEEERPQPEGTVVKVGLSTNPKRHPKAKPGSLYMDIGRVRRAFEGEYPIANQYNAPQGDPRDDWGAVSSDASGMQTPAGWHAYDPKHYYFVEKDRLKTEQILKSQAWNGLTAMLAAHGASDGVFDVDQLRGLWHEWHEGYEALKRGEVPFTSEPEPAEKPEPEFESAMAPPEDTENDWAPTPAGEGYSEGEQVPGW